MPLVHTQLSNGNLRIQCHVDDLLYFSTNNNREGGRAGGGGATRNYTKRKRVCGKAKIVRSISLTIIL